jgi:hypothetical protein
VAQFKGAPHSVPLLGVTANHFSPEVVVAVAIKETFSSTSKSTDIWRTCAAGGVAPITQVN